MIKLIVSDIDGTLLRDGGNELNPELFDVILKLRKQGMQFAAATGRQWVSIERVFDPVKEKIFYAIFILSIVATILINKKCQTEPKGTVLFGTKRRKK